MSIASREDQRDRVLEAALVHIPFDVWSRRSLFAGARDLGLDPGLVRRLFPGGGDDLLAQLERWADRRMLAQIDLDALAALRVRDRIATLVRVRLETLAPHREAMRRGVAARLLPGNALAGYTSIWRTVDLMWSLAGDKAQDYNYYTKRSLLAAVWTSTFLFWLEDRSEGLRDSWAFLDRRIGDVMRIGGLPARVGDALRSLGRLNPLASHR
jgi:ubiquinone biosynthesis protein COQ9